MLPDLAIRRKALMRFSGLWASGMPLHPWAQAKTRVADAPFDIIPVDLEMLFLNFWVIVSLEMEANYRIKVKSI